MAQERQIISGSTKPLVRCLGTRLSWREFPRFVSDRQARAKYNKNLLREIADHIGPDFRGARVLDAACGTNQVVVRHLWQEANVRVGLDIDPASLAKNQDVDVAVCGDLQTLPFDDHSFDVVVSLDTLEHSDRPVDFMRELSRILRPDGLVLIFTSHLWGYRALIAKPGKRLAHDLAYTIFYKRTRPYGVYYRANTSRAIKRLASEEGLSLREVYYVPEILHFFYRSKLLYTLAFLYNSLAIRLNMPWLLNYMVAVLEKPGLHASVIDSPASPHEYALESRDLVEQSDSSGSRRSALDPKEQQ